jgi:hypothetical protein
MKRAITLPRPGLGFPDAGWRERFQAFVEAAARAGLELEAGLGSGATAGDLAGLESAVGALPAELRALLAAANGGRIGHLALHPARKVAQLTPGLRARASGLERSAGNLDDVAGSDLVAFAADISGNTYAARPGSPAHVVVCVTGDRSAAEHRFTTVGCFLESALVRAYAAALHRKAEAEAGDDLDDTPWLDAARRLETEIDPTMLRTRED